MPSSLHGPESTRTQEELGGVRRTRIAIPCVGRANLQARVSHHFGCCDSYVVVTLEEARIKSVESIRNGKHSHCVESVKALAQHAIGLTLVGTMGVGGWEAARKLGIEVRCGIAGTVAQAVDSYLNGETLLMGEDALCTCGPRCS
jgi:predicted Fe-Mo cluster-binding NifX family protein